MWRASLRLHGKWEGKFLLSSSHGKADPSLVTTVVTSPTAQDNPASKVTRSHRAHHSQSEATLTVSLFFLFLRFTSFLPSPPSPPLLSLLLPLALQKHLSDGSPFYPILHRHLVHEKRSRVKPPPFNQPPTPRRKASSIMTAHGGWSVG